MGFVSLRMEEFAEYSCKINYKSSLGVCDISTAVTHQEYVTAFTYCILIKFGLAECI